MFLYLRLDDWYLYYLMAIGVGVTSPQGFPTTDTVGRIVILDYLTGFDYLVKVKQNKGFNSVLFFLPHCDRGQSFIT